MRIIGRPPWPNFRHTGFDKGTDVVFALRWPIIAVILAALYHITVLIGGGVYSLA